MENRHHLTILPMQWSALPELHDAPLIDDTDAECLDELRHVLARHGKLRRFAIHLAHRHIALEPGEVLIERPDPDGRTQHVTVGRLADEPNARPTTWMFDDTLRMNSAVFCICVSDPTKTDTCARHGRSSSPGEAYDKAKAAEIQRIFEEWGRYQRGFPTAGHDRER